MSHKKFRIELGQLLQDLSTSSSEVEMRDPQGLNQNLMDLFYRQTLRGIRLGHEIHTQGGYYPVYWLSANSKAELDGWVATIKEAVAKMEAEWLEEAEQRYQEMNALRQNEVLEATLEALDALNQEAIAAINVQAILQETFAAGETWAYALKAIQDALNPSHQDIKKISLAISKCWMEYADVEDLDISVLDKRDTESDARVIYSFWDGILCIGVSFN